MATRPIRSLADEEYIGVTFSATFRGGMLGDMIEIDIDSCTGNTIWYFDSFVAVLA